MDVLSPNFDFNHMKTFLKVRKTIDQLMALLNLDQSTVLQFANADKATGGQAGRRVCEAFSTLKTYKVTDLSLFSRKWARPLNRIAFQACSLIAFVVWAS